MFYLGQSYLGQFLLRPILLCVVCCVLCVCVVVLLLCVVA